MNKSSLLNSRSYSKWKAIGTDRRAGVTVPLFSVYSKKSFGIGEIPDLKHLIDWCSSTGMSILQLLPMNDTAYDFSPYNSLSTFAIDPMYISISKLKNTDLKPFRSKLARMKKKYPATGELVNYDIKNIKLSLLREIFDKLRIDELEGFRTYLSKNQHWLKFYSLYKVLLGNHYGKHWEDWEFRYKYISPLTTEKVLNSFRSEILFHSWVQWQLFEQMVSVKAYARKKRVLLFGDLPFLVSRNSADVWAYKNFFKLDLSSGAPPDMYMARGQRWGMPPYNWDNIASHNYAYIRERLKYSENFYDMFRIDHFIGLFRVWTIDLKLDEKHGGMTGKFDPDEEQHWESHGAEILKVINESTSMLPCAEDLGTVPECSPRVLKQFGIPGIEVQRWTKRWDGSFDFLPAEDYRLNSVAALSTHDSSPLPIWWNYEAGSIDEFSFRQTCMKIGISKDQYAVILGNIFEKIHEGQNLIYWNKEIKNVYQLLEILSMSFDKARDIVSMYLSTFGEKEKFLNYIGYANYRHSKANTQFMKLSLEKISSSNSIFSVQLITEYLFLDKKILDGISKRNYRINTPGTVSGSNWSMKIPLSLEELKEHRINSIIRKINQKYNRVV